MVGDNSYYSWAVVSGRNQDGNRALYVLTRDIDSFYGNGDADDDTLPNNIVTEYLRRNGFTGM